MSRLLCCGVNVFRIRRRSSLHENQSALPSNTARGGGGRFKCNLHDSGQSIPDSDLSLQLGTVISFSELESLLPTILVKCIPSCRNVTFLWAQNLANTIGQINLLLKHDITKILAPPYSYKVFCMGIDELSHCLHWSKSDSTCESSKSENVTQSQVLVMGFYNSDQNMIALILSTCGNTWKDGEIALRYYQKQISIVLQRLERLQQTLDRSQNHSSTKTSSEFPCLSQNILQLCGSLFDQHSGTLQLKVLDFLLQQTQAGTGCLLMYNADSAELINEVYGSVTRKEVWRVQIQCSKFHELLEQSSTLRQTRISPEWLEELQPIMTDVDIKDKSFLCVPLVSRATQRVIAFACLFSKQSNGEGFHDTDETILRECFHYTSSVLTSAIAFQTELRLKRQTERMLQVAKNIFSRMDNLKMLLLEIMREARNLTQAERCSVFILDKDSNELVAKVFDGVATAPDKNQALQEKCVLEDGTEIEQPVEIRIPSTQGIAGHVATTGEMLNIKDAYSHPLFYRKVDDDTGFKTRNILCFPIRNDHGTTVGVAQLCNKMKGSHFTKVDEEIASVFAIYCGISIVHSLMFQKIEDAQQRIRLTTELMTYHMQVPDEAVMSLSLCKIPAVKTFLRDPLSFESIPRSVPESEGALATISMFEEMGMITRWRLHRRTLARFVLRVKRGYRDPAYHNWMHAFSVGHFVYICVKNLPLHKQLTDLELLAVFVASLCHDIDHRGTNNLFQVESKSVLAALYSSEGSVLERHHLAQTMCILNTEGCNLFENLSQQDYSKILDYMRDCILATDLAHHLKIMPDLMEMAKVGVNPNESRHHYLLLCLLMTAADLSDQTKNWKNTRSVAELIYKEFFTQGDLEKMLGQKPAEQMDRERACVPELQVSFLTHIALPLYKVVSAIYPECEPIISTIERNRHNWMEINSKVKSGEISGNSDEIFRLPFKEKANLPLTR